MGVGEHPRGLNRAARNARGGGPAPHQPVRTDIAEFSFDSFRDCVAQMPFFNEIRISRIEKLFITKYRVSCGKRFDGHPFCGCGYCGTASLAVIAVPSPRLASPELLASSASASPVIRLKRTSSTTRPQGCGARMLPKQGKSPEPSGRSRSKWGSEITRAGVGKSVGSGGSGQRLAARSAVRRRRDVA